MLRLKKKKKSGWFLYVLNTSVPGRCVLVSGVKEVVGFRPGGGLGAVGAAGDKRVRTGVCVLRLGSTARSVCGSPAIGCLSSFWYKLGLCGGLQCHKYPPPPKHKQSGGVSLEG